MDDNFIDQCAREGIHPYEKQRLLAEDAANAIIASNIGEGYDDAINRVAIEEAIGLLANMMHLANQRGWSWTHLLEQSTVIHMNEYGDVPDGRWIEE